MLASILQDSRNGFYGTDGRMQKVRPGIPGGRCTGSSLSLPGLEVCLLSELLLKLEMILVDPGGPWGAL